MVTDGYGILWISASEQLKIILNTGTVDCCESSNYKFTVCVCGNFFTFKKDKITAILRLISKHWNNSVN